MGTRSDIIVECNDGKWRRIYCHWDGYLSHNGQILFDHYTTQEKCEALVALGDLSTLGAEIGVKHAFDERPEGHCTAYGRDRGEKGTEAKVGDTIQSVWPDEDTWTEFTYVWRSNPAAPDQRKWFVASADAGTQALIDLGDALLGRVDVDANVKVPFAGITLGKHAKPPLSGVPPLADLAKRKT